MNDKEQGLLVGAFLGDSLALGAHWIYDTNVIDEKLGRITELVDPLAKYHPNRSAGEQTHYGDQMFLFYKHLKLRGGLYAAEYLKTWIDFFDNYDGYKDHAMSETKENLSLGKSPSGSGSTDLSGVFYVPPLIIAGGPDSNVNEAVQMTHNSSEVISSANFLAQILTDVLNNIKPISSIKKILSSDSLSSELSVLVQNGLESIGQNTRETIKAFGQSCPADKGIPGVIHLIGTYENDFENGLIENVMAGGDSAARGIFIGAVLGAYNGYKKIPTIWASGLKAGV